MQRHFSTLEYEEYYLIKGCSQVAGFRDYHLDSGEKQLGEQTRFNKVRMVNSMNQECVLEFQTYASLRAWKQAVETAANEINQVLGKPEFTRQESAVVEKQDDPQQVLGHVDIALKKLEIVLEGTSKIKLKSRIVNPSQRDVIVLSAQQPRQFNRQVQEPPCLENQWVYAMVFQKFSLGYVYRQWDDDRSIAIRSLQIEDKTFERGPHQVRFPLLLKSQGKQGGSHLVLQIVIKSQSSESPRFQNVLMANEIKIGTLHFNWQPVSVNRLTRFLRYMKYVKDVYH